MFNLVYYGAGGFEEENKGWFNTIEEIYEQLDKDGWLNSFAIDWEEEGYTVYDKDGKEIEI